MAPLGGDVVALLFTQMPLLAARVSCVWIVALGIPLDGRVHGRLLLARR